MNNSASMQLVIAAGMGNLALVKFNVKLGADIHYKNEYALFDAVMNGHAEGRFDVIKYLVENGADLRAKHEEYEFGILYAPSVRGNLELVQYLVENGADIYDIRKFIGVDEVVKDWAEKYISSMEMKDKLSSELKIGHSEKPISERYNDSKI